MKHKLGITLIEILVVIALIALILAFVPIPPGKTLRTSQTNAKMLLVSSYLRTLSKDRAAILMPRDIGFLSQMFPVLRRVQVIAEYPTTKMAGLDDQQVLSPAAPRPRQHDPQQPVAILEPRALELALVDCQLVLRRGDLLRVELARGDLVIEAELGLHQ